MNSWLVLVIALPTANATERMRAWRALKANGAAVLRDGVYLLPQTLPCRTALEAVAREIRAIEGTACLLPVQDPEGARFIPLFDRHAAFAQLQMQVDSCRAALSPDNALDLARQVRKLRKTFAQLAATDYFPGEPQQQAEARLLALEVALKRTLSADEPRADEGPIQPLACSDYQGRTWATRKRPWVDRLASAWLIRRFIDPAARILWLDAPQDCPVDALGFDFDGAAFSHVGSRVTFETLQASFALQAAGLARMAALVHYLDAGGMQPLEAPGTERILAGLRQALSDDDQLLTAAAVVFDGLLAAFAQDE